ncbi:DUF4296 domain-containing protein [Flavimarina sp. Hel_I_48]|uniref:DUF4296 domain-containing protein n=1 Tax=Flavimarina sp. Hel_I_48 TaxID=1392488 RepID=UPI00068A1897|nr:DUF4296 domain-containing protein [Flavimarina sp. Hel_I_48]
MIKALYILLTLLLFASCQNVERPEKPDNLIPEDKLKDILYDVSLVNAARDFSRGQLKNAGIKPDTFIYKKYDIDSLQFAGSLAYYSVDFNRYLKIWEEVSERLEVKRDAVDSLIRRTDSILAAEGKVPDPEPRTGLMDPDELKREPEN